LQAIAERAERQAQESASWQAKEEATGFWRTKLQCLCTQNRLEAAQQLTDELCGKLGHAPRLPIPKPHHQHMQEQARYPAAAAAAAATAAVRRARRARRTAVIVAR